jgi:hypothetical protein
MRPRPAAKPITEENPMETTLMKIVMTAPMIKPLLSSRRPARKGSLATISEYLRSKL